MSMSVIHQQKEIAMIIVRVATGIKSHWQIRLTEWLMVYPAIGMGIVLLYQPDLFSTSRAFDQIAQWADQSTWALFVLVCAMSRLVALTVNGTFAGFPYSPHMRLVASFIGIAFWSQFCLGLTTAALLVGSSWTGPVVYSTLCLGELLNFYRSWSDIARGKGHIHGNGRF